jgi:hypothetical protein
MPRRHPVAARIAAALLFAITLSACSHPGKTDANGIGLAVGLAAASMSKPPSSDETPGRISLPNPNLIRCSTSSCPPVLTDGTELRAVYPWQVSLDYTNGSVIGLTALYDQPTSIGDVQAAIDERYRQWAMVDFRTGPLRLWRIEPERFVIQLSQTDTGMVRLIYLTFDPKHPTSDKALGKILDRIAKGGN